MTSLQQSPTDDPSTFPDPPPARASVAAAASWPARTAAVACLWGLAVFGSTRIHLDKNAHHYAIVLHLLSLTLGFGSVLSTDMCALSGLVRRRGFTLAQAVRVAGVLDPLIWAGYLGLIVSGLLLRQDLGSALMWVKLGAALLVGLNGVNAHGVMRALSALPREGRLADLPRPTAIRAVASVSLSQGAWWTAILVGFFGT